MYHHNVTIKFNPVYLLITINIDHLFYTFINRALAGKGLFIENFRNNMNRSGYLEEVYFSFSFNPIFTDDRKVGGLMSILQEVTQKVLLTRRLRTLKELANKTQGTILNNDPC